MARIFLRALLVGAVGFLLSACVPRSELFAAQSENENLRAQVALLEKQNGELRAQVVSAVEGLTAAKERLARKPAMPVTVSLRRALLGSAYVAVFATTVKEDFPVLVTVKSTALGTSKQFRVQLNASGTSELGSIEGAAIDIDDEMLIENNKFEPASLKFHKR